MTKICVALFALVFLLDPALAADKVKISFQDAIILNNALSALDGRERVVKDGERERVVSEPYDLGPGLRAAIGKNLTRLKAPVEIYSNAEKGLRNEITKGGVIEIKAGSPEVELFIQKRAELLKLEESIEPLIRIKRSELKLEKNPIPGTVLSAMDPILDD